MGVCQSDMVVVANPTTLAIDKQLQIERKRQSIEHKLLLLGAAECGKSTILKQMRILHHSGFSDEDLKSNKPAIFSFMMTSMLKIADAMPRHKVSFPDSGYEVLVKALRKHLAAGYEDSMVSEVTEILKRLWVDPAIQKMIQWASQYHLSESAVYFFDSLDRISKSEYTPTVQDVLRVKVKTTGVVELTLQLRQAPLRVLDVGGQKSERRKWIHCFDNVNSVVFITAINEYDELLEEDDITNRMADSLRLFAYICNHDFFLKTGMILFLNKKDLFAEKLSKVPLHTFFKNYTGPNEYESAVDFVKQEFMALNKVSSKVVYTHETCATDTDQVKHVLDSCFDLIFRQAATSIGYI